MPTSQRFSHLLLVTMQAASLHPLHVAYSKLFSTTSMFTKELNWPSLKAYYKVSDQISYGIEKCLSDMIKAVDEMGSALVEHINKEKKEKELNNNDERLTNLEDRVNTYKNIVKELCVVVEDLTDMTRENIENLEDRLQKLEKKADSSNEIGITISPKMKSLTIYS